MENHCGWVLAAASLTSPRICKIPNTHYLLGILQIRGEVRLATEIYRLPFNFIDKDAIGGLGLWNGS